MVRHIADRRQLMLQEYGGINYAIERGDLSPGSVAFDWVDSGIESAGEGPERQEREFALAQVLFEAGCRICFPSDHRWLSAECYRLGFDPDDPMVFAMEGDEGFAPVRVRNLDRSAEPVFGAMRSLGLGAPEERRLFAAYVGQEEKLGQGDRDFVMATYRLLHYFSEEERAFRLLSRRPELAPYRLAGPRDLKVYAALLAEFSEPDLTPEAQEELRQLRRNPLAWGMLRQEVATYLLHVTAQEEYEARVMNRLLGLEEGG